MKKTILTAMIVSVFVIFLLSGTPLNDLAVANWALPPDYAVITIQSPQNTTYNENLVYLNFTVERNYRYRTSYVLDETEPVVIEPTQTSSTPIVDAGGLNYTRWTGQGNATLANLTDGVHVLTVREYVLYTAARPEDPPTISIVNSTTVSFTVNTQQSPSESIPPTPSLSTPTPTITPTPSPSDSQKQTPESAQPNTLVLTLVDPPDYVSLFLQVIGLVVGVIACVSLLVYLNRRTKKKTENQ